MADFGIKLKNKFDTDTFEGTKATCEWIINALHSLCPTAKVNIEISFKLSDISCSVKSFEEFIENAYGSSDFHLTSIMCFIIDRANFIASVMVFCGDIDVSANTRHRLEQIVHLLTTTELSNVSTIPTSQTVFIAHNEGIVGDINHSQVSLDSGKEKSTIKKWAEAIIQNLLANWIGYLLTLIGTAAITYFLSK